MGATGTVAFEWAEYFGAGGLFLNQALAVFKTLRNSRSGTD